MTIPRRKDEGMIQGRLAEQENEYAVNDRKSMEAAAVNT